LHTQPTAAGEEKKEAFAETKAAEPSADAAAGAAGVAGAVGSAGSAASSPSSSGDPLLRELLLRCLECNFVLLRDLNNFRPAQLDRDRCVCVQWDALV
jgi:hypothetical protein